MKRTAKRDESHLACFLPILKIELVQRFDVIARERDGHEHGALFTEARETLEGVYRLRPHPRAGPDLGLPYEAVGIRVSQTIHHRRHGRGNFEHVWVAPVDDGHWERMGGEEQHNIATFVFWEFLKGSFNILGNGLVRK